MSEASRPEAGVRTVVCYALCGPPIGVWSVYLLTQASAALASRHAPPFAPSIRDGVDFIAGLILMMPLGYAFGLLPALATGLLAARLGRMAGARGLHALASGALGAATSVVINFALFALHGMAGGAAGEQRLFPLGAAGFIAAFVCGLILHVGERGAAGSWARPTPS